MTVGVEVIGVRAMVGWSLVGNCQESEQKQATINRIIIIDQNDSPPRRISRLVVVTLTLHTAAAAAAAAAAAFV